MAGLSRSTALKIAAVLSFVFNLVNIVFALPIVIQGMNAVNQNPDMPPFWLMMGSVILGSVGMVAAFGVWKQQRWAIIFTILVSLLGVLSAAPGILFAPNQSLWISALSGTLMGIVIIVLCLWRDRRTTLAV